MKATSSLLGCAVLALVAPSAFAESVTVRLTGHITTSTVDEIYEGLPVTATYTYETNTPDEEPSSDVGRYQPPVSDASVRVSAGSFVFESASPPAQPMPRLDIWALRAPAPQLGLNWMGLQISSYENKPAFPGSIIESISVDIWNFSGYAPATDALPTQAPDVQQFENREIRISGFDADSNQIWIVASIETAQLVPPGIDVSPASSYFLPQQQFDAALLLQPGSSVASMSASAGGVALPLSYPGTCQLTTTGGSPSRPAILCPNAHSALVGAASSQIQWQVELSDSTVLDETVDWRLIQ